jgi:hypothetical protein
LLPDNIDQVSAKPKQQEFFASQFSLWKFPGSLTAVLGELAIKLGRPNILAAQPNQHNEKRSWKRQLSQLVPQSHGFAILADRHFAPIL